MKRSKSTILVLTAALTVSVLLTPVAFAGDAKSATVQASGPGNYIISYTDGSKKLTKTVTATKAGTLHVPLPSGATNISVSEENQPKDKKKKN